MEGSGFETRWAAPNEPITPAVPDRSESDAVGASGDHGRRAGSPQTGPGESLAGDLLNVIRGFCMGAADTVPGVSGGTVALILGHYERLVAAISQLDLTAVGMFKDKQFAAVAKHTDARFLVALAVGIGIGVITLSGLMHWLLDHRMPHTLAVFLGLLLASLWVVQRSIDRWTLGRVVAALAGAVVAIAITILPAAAGNLALPYLFFSAAVAICAMILPGISGAFVLLLLGVYHHVTGLVKETVQGQIPAGSLVQMVVFGAGCVIGLLTFSRVLKWLLDHHHELTMAWLLGLMVGSMGKLWPLQQPTAETAGLELKFRQMEYVAPWDWQGNLLVLVALVLISAMAVWGLERVAHGQALARR